MNDETFDNGKEFRNRFIKETKEKSSDNLDYASEKAVYRGKKYHKKWKNFSVTAPSECVEFLKQQFNSFKKQHEKLWDIVKYSNNSEEGETD